jgi:hypothetical protein
MHIPASFRSFSHRSFVFKDIPASFRQKRIFFEFHPLSRIDDRQKSVPDKSSAVTAWFLLRVDAQWR